MFGVTVLAARFPGVIGTRFVMHFSLSAMTNYAAAARFGYLLIITIPRLDIVPLSRGWSFRVVVPHRYR